MIIRMTRLSVRACSIPHLISLWNFCQQRAVHTAYQYR